MSTRASLLEQLFASGDAGELERFGALMHEDVIGRIMELWEIVDTDSLLTQLRGADSA